jgi:N-acyl-D-aspartate/D-glutamate deacylase
VTTSLELELGTADADGWYAERAGKALINHGVGSGHVPVRMEALRDPGPFMPTGAAANRAASASELAQILQAIERNLQRGALSVGVGLNYTPAASRDELLGLCRLAAKYRAPVHLHLRHMGMEEPDSATAALYEAISAVSETAASLHVAHITSMGLGDTANLLTTIRAARARGLDITVEAYPYSAASTGIESAIFDGDWQKRMGISYGDLQWSATGERLTAESFAAYRRQGGFVVSHMIPEEEVRRAVADPDVIIASDGVPLVAPKVHPRGQGSFARVLGHYVREEQVTDLMTALRKMTLLPARRLETRAPAFRRKGRLGIGADADLTIFDPATVIDRATYDEPLQYSEGIRFVLVNGVPVVSDGDLTQGAFPGRPARAPV